MSGENLLKTYPNAAKVVKEWFMNQMIVSMESDNITPQEFKDAMVEEGISNERLGTLIDIQPRTFLDCFDDNKIYIEIQVSSGKNVKFTYFVNRIHFNTIQYSTRREAELEATDKAFSLLEKQLEPLIFEQLNKEEENETK